MDCVHTQLLATIDEMEIQEPTITNSSDPAHEGSSRPALARGVRLLASPLLAATLLLQTSACASIQTSRQKIDTKIRTDASRKIARGSEEFSVVHELQGTTLSISVEREMVCKDLLTPVYASEEHVTRTLAPGGARSYGPRTTGLMGAVFVASGGYSYFQANSLAGESDSATDSEYRTAGLASAAIGVGLLVVALVDSQRLKDEVRDLGTYEGEPAISRRPCRKGPAAKQTVRVVAHPGRFEAAASTDSEGTAEVPLLDVPENVLIDDNFALALEVSGDEIPLPVSQGEVHSILERLGANAASRIFRDRSANLARNCQKWIKELESHDEKVSHLPELTMRWDEIGTQCESVLRDSFVGARKRFDEMAKQLREEERLRAGTLAATRPLQEILEKAPANRIPEERQRLEGAPETDRRRFALTPQDWEVAQKSSLAIEGRFPLASVIGKSITQIRAAIGPPRKSTWKNNGDRIDGYDAGSRTVDLLYSGPVLSTVVVDGQSEGTLEWLGLIVSLKKTPYFMGDGAITKIGGEQYVVQHDSTTHLVMKKKHWDEIARELAVENINEHAGTNLISTSPDGRAMIVAAANCSNEALMEVVDRFDLEEVAQNRAFKLATCAEASGKQHRIDFVRLRKTRQRRAAKVANEQKRKNEAQRAKRAVIRAQRAADRVRSRAERQERRSRRSGASLVCRDGSYSPTCTCGGSRRGCCSHHGGVRGCSQ